MGKYYFYAFAIFMVFLIAILIGKFVQIFLVISSDGFSAVEIFILVGLSVVALACGLLGRKDYLRVKAKQQK